MKKRAKINPYKTDRENPAWTAKDFRRARPASEVAPRIVAAYKTGTLRVGGRPPGSDKTPVSLRIDNDVLDFFKTKGAGWQTRINEALRAIVNVAR